MSWKNKAECLCTWLCPRCAHKHGGTNRGYLSDTLQCRYDYAQISTMSTPKYTHYVSPSNMPPPFLQIARRNGALLAL